MVANFGKTCLECEGMNSKSDSSAVFRVNEVHERQAHFLSLLPSTSTIATTQQDITNGNTELAANARSSPIDFRVQVEASAFLAVQHLNAKSGTILQTLPSLLQSCDTRFTLEMRDTRFSPIQAIRELLFALQGNSTDPNQGLANKPAAIIGGARSAESQVISVLGGVFEIPQISSSSTSGALDNKDVSPYFARTIPTNAGDAKAILAYFGSMQVANFGVLYVNDDYGNYYAQALNDDANANGLKIELVSFEDSVESSIEAAVDRLKQSGIKYFVGIFDPGTWRQVVRVAFLGGIMGRPGYTWLFSDASLEITQPGFSLNRSSELDLAQAIHGSGVVSLSLKSQPAFDRVLREFYLNKTLQEEFIASHPDYHEFDGYNFTFTNSSSSSLLYQYLAYDAVIAMGLAVCNTSQNAIAGPELYRALLNVEFQGASGLVRFSNASGTRLVGDVSYSVQNVLRLGNQNNNDVVEFTSQIAAQIYPNCDGKGSKCSIQVLEAFVFADSSKSPPPQLPPLREDLNLIPLPVRVLGWVMCAIVIIVSIGWMLWTYRYRSKDVVRASQPIFLVVLCVGCCVMASAIIPLSLQEPSSSKLLDMGCMATPWLLSVGFVLTFSALFSKTWRLNKLFHSGEAFRRVRLRPLDVVVPLVSLMCVNVAVLTIWTLVSPLYWFRVPILSNVDTFGRYPDSFGSCYWNSDKDYQYVFLIGVILVDAIALVFANYQSYLARDIPTDFSESFYVAISMASLLEAFFLGAPIVFLVRDNPTAFFLILSILISIACLVILLPIFVPKYMLRNLYQRRPGRHGRRMSVAVSNASRTSQDDGVLKEEISGSAASIMGASKITRSAEYFELRRSACGGSENDSGDFGRQRAPDLRRRSVAFGQVTLVDVPLRKTWQPSNQEFSNSTNSSAPFERLETLTEGGTSKAVQASVIEGIESSVENR